MDNDTRPGSADRKERKKVKTTVSGDDTSGTLKER